MLDLRARCRPGPRGQRSPAGGGTATAQQSPAGGTATTAQPCVLLVSRAADRELRSVEVLLSKIGIPAARINAETASSAGFLADLDSRTIQLHGHQIRPTVTWVRHFSARAISDRRGAVHQRFLRDSWQAAVVQLAAVSGVLIAAEGPGLMTQLALAAANGIKIPRTVVTTDPVLAKDRLTGTRVVIKALHQHFVEARPGLLSGVFPDLADRSLLRPAPGPARPPVVVQEYVEHDLELRTYYVHGEILGFAVAKDTAADPWLHAERVRVREAEIPAAVLAATRLLAAAMSIEYGAFDFLVKDGAPIFLEANLAGDWCWLEALTGTTPVTMAVVRMLRDLHLRAAGESRPAGDHPRKAIELTTFLAGRPGSRPGQQA